MAVGVFQGRFGRVSLFETDRPVHQHAHPQFHVVIKVAGVDGAYDIEGHGACPVTDDRLMLLNPWTAHANWRPAGQGRTTLLALYLEASWVVRLDGRPERRRLFHHPSGVVTETVRQAADRLGGLLTCPEPTTGEAVEAALQQTLSTVVESYGDGARLPVAAAALDSRVRRAVVAMRRCAGSGIDIDAVCREAGLSRSRLYEQFRATVGIPPGLYADGLRLEAAIEALTASGQPIGEIALNLGFAAQGHFSRFFREKTGFSPSEYRRGLSALEE